MATWKENHRSNESRNKHQTQRLFMAPERSASTLGGPSAFQISISGFPRSICLLFPYHHAVGMFCNKLVIDSSECEHVFSGRVGDVTRRSHDYLVSIPVDGEIRRSKGPGHIGPNGLFADDGSSFRRKNGGIIRPECSGFFRVPGLYGGQPPRIRGANGGFHLCDIYRRLRADCALLRSSPIATVASRSAKCHTEMFECQGCSIL